MNSNLAIEGGTKIFADDFKFAPWPPVRQETGDKLCDLYMSAKAMKGYSK